MKKILLLLLIIISINGLAQFPATQSQGTVNTRVINNGGFQAMKGLINGVFADTTAANADYIDFYNGAQIYTRSDRNFWLRDSVLNSWVRMAKFSDVGSGQRFGVSGEDATATQNRTFNQSTYDLTLTHARGYTYFGGSANPAFETYYDNVSGQAASISQSPGTFTMYSYGGGDYNSLSLTSSTSSNHEFSIVQPRQQFYIRGDSMQFKPFLGRINIDSLRLGNSYDSVMTWNKQTGTVGYRAASSFGSNSIYNESVVKSNDSVFLRGEKTYTPATNTVYGRDNANNPGYHSAAVINLTNVENKHFLNYKNGEWVNSKYFQELKFVVDEDVINYPISGDSTFTDTVFSYKKLNFFREGILQYEGDTINGYTINHTTGVFTAHPPFFANERMIFQFYDTLQWNTITHSNVVAEEYVVFNVAGDLTESPTGTWSSASGSGMGYSTKSLASGDDGYFVIQNNASGTDTNPFGLDTYADNTTVDYAFYKASAFRLSGTYWYYDFSSPGVAVNSGVTATTGDWLRFYVASGVIKLQYSTNSGSTWTDIHTFSTSSTGITLYAKTSLPVGGKKIQEAKIYNFH